AVYKISLTANQVRNLAVGEFPAFALRAQNENGAWQKREKTVATVTKTSDEYFTCEIPLKHLSEKPAIAIDFGEGNLVQIENDAIANAPFSEAESSSAGKKKLASADYKTLDMMFPGKPRGGITKMARAGLIGMPVALGFAFGGPAGAAFGTIPAARTIV